MKKEDDIKVVAAGECGCCVACGVLISVRNAACMAGSNNEFGKTTREREDSSNNKNKLQHHYYDY
jgi:hypothetical protein